MRLLQIRSIVWIVTLLAVPRVSAQTDHSGTCTGTFAAADNPHRLTGDCTVPAAQTLALEAGVVLDGQGRRLIVNGMLEADGVTFTAVLLEYRDGSGGTVRNSILTADGILITLSGSSVNNPAMPILDRNTMETTDFRFAQAVIDVRGTARPTIANNRVTGAAGGVIYRGTSAGLLSENTITAPGTVAEVTQSAQPSIRGNTLGGGFTGLRYSDTAAGEARGNTINFPPGSSTNHRGIEVTEQAAPVVDGNTVNNDPTRQGIGIRIATDPVSLARVTNNLICSTGTDRPFVVTPAFFDITRLAAVSGNMLVCEPGRGVGIDGGNVRGEAVFTEVDGIASLLLLSTVVVDAGARLTIAPGTTLAGEGNSLRANGRVNADGVTFLNVRLDFDLGSSGMIENSMILSSPGFASSIVDVNGATVTLNGNVIDGSATAVVLAGAANVIAEENVFRGNGTVFDLSGGALAQLTVADNLFDDNTYAVSYFPNAQPLFSVFPAQLDTNTFAGAANRNTIRLPATLNVSGTLGAAPVPYACDRATTISAGVTMTMEPGTTVQGTAGCGITVGGELVAAGTPERPVVFTAAAPESGTRWQGLSIPNKPAGSPTVLENCVVQFAGRINRPGILLDNASIPIRNCLIAYNNANGIDLVNDARPLIEDSAVVQNLTHGISTGSGSAPVVRGSSLFGNRANGIQNDDSSTVIDAQNNYWGDDSGPFDLPADTRCETLSNPDGLGEEVSDCVDYDPFVRVGPSVAGTLRVISGNGQQGALGEILPQPLTVEIRSTLGSLLEGIEVIFSVVEGAASIIEPQPVRTGPDGRASATVRLGSTPGEILIAVTARDVASPLAVFMAEANAPCLITLQALAPSGWVCPGDCDGQGEVSIDELMMGVRAALGDAALEECPSVDSNNDGEITVDELISAVNHSLAGCPG